MKCIAFAQHIHSELWLFANSVAQLIFLDPLKLWSLTLCPPLHVALNAMRSVETPEFRDFFFFPVHLLQRLRPKIRKRNKTNYIQIFEQSDLGMARKKHKFVYLVLLIANKTVTCLSVSCGIFAFDSVEMEKNGV